jgi:ribosomal protein S18 acetylase RimI-like enzyme
MLLRQAVHSDIPHIMSVIKKVVPLMIADGNLQWDNGYPNPQIFEQDVEQQQLWLVEINGNVAGLAAITTDQDKSYADAGYDITEPAIVVHRLAVDTDYRGNGIAEALLKKAEQVAIERGIMVLRIDTNTKNSATQKLFPKLGYTLGGEISLGFRAGLRFFCYEKRLPITHIQTS